ncbi:MAG: Tol-Pal system protein TolB [Campylobacterales bacterium]
MRFFWVLFLAASLYAADATLEVIKEVGTALNVTVESKGLNPSLIDRRIGRMIEADLKVAGFYNVVPAPAEGGPSFDPGHAIYRNAGLDHLVRYDYFSEPGRLGIRAEVYDVKAKKPLISRTYTVSREERFPFLAHHLTIDLAKKLGIDGLEWMGKFVILSRHVGPKETEILIADYSLTFKQAVIKGGFNIFPKWADTEQKAFYYTHYLDKPTLYRVDLYTGERTKITESEGMLVCSDVSRDGKRLLLTMAPDDQPDIFEYNLATRQAKRLSEYSGIDVNGHYVDDESALLFVSDRLGYPEIFYAPLNAPASATQFVFKGRNNNYINTWKNYAVFVSRDTDSEFAENTFNLYLISTKSDFIRQLTTTGKNNFPRFSPSGDTILHTKEFKKESALGIIRLGYNKSFLFPLEKGQIQAIDW